MVLENHVQIRLNADVDEASGGQPGVDAGRYALPHERLRFDDDQARSFGAGWRLTRQQRLNARHGNGHQSPPWSLSEGDGTPLVSPMVTFGHNGPTVLWTERSLLL